MSGDTAVLLRRTVAEFFSVDEGDVGPSFALTGHRGASSIARAALDAAIRRRMGLKAASIYTANTFGELQAALTGEAPSPALATAQAANAGVSPTPTATTPDSLLACGVDLELIANLPPADDCWTDPFYTATFAPAEIAYCLVQPDPAPHFCARWCAKEALKKCEPALGACRPNLLEVAHEASGAPFLIHHVDGTARRLPHAVSLSHTELAAVAVVVRAEAPVASPALLPTPSVAEAASAAESAVSHTRRGRGGVVAATVLALAALAIAAVALWRTFLTPP
jgi:phosphopantetheinyl transferase (holo-ACP synthase)